MGKWVPVIAGALLAAYATMGDVLGPLVASNPKLAFFIGVVIAVLTYLAKSPLKGK